MREFNRAWPLTENIRVFTRRYAGSVTDLKERFGRNVSKTHGKVLRQAGDIVDLYRDLRTALLCGQIHQRHPLLVEIGTFNWHISSVSLAATAVIFVAGVETKRIISGTFDTRLLRIYCENETNLKQWLTHVCISQEEDAVRIKTRSGTWQ
jgi:hypothetical protein